MNSDQIEDAARETARALREGTGSIFGKDGMRGQGAVGLPAGALQHGYGEIKERAETIVDNAPALGDVAKAARKLGRQITDTLQDQFGEAAPTYTLAGAIGFLAIAVLWAGRDRG